MMCVRRTFKWEREDGPRKVETQLREQGPERGRRAFRPLTKCVPFSVVHGNIVCPRASDARHSAAGQASRALLGGRFETPHEMDIHPIDHHDDADAIAATEPSAALAARLAAQPGGFGGGVCL